MVRIGAPLLICDVKIMSCARIEISAKMPEGSNVIGDIQRVYEYVTGVTPNWNDVTGVTPNWSDVTGWRHAKLE